MPREQQLAQCAEQLLASIVDGQITGELVGYYEDIFTEALKGTLHEEETMKQATADL